MLVNARHAVNGDGAPIALALDERGYRHQVVVVDFVDRVTTVRSIDPAAKRTVTDAGTFDADVLVVRGADRAVLHDVLSKHGAWPREAWDADAIVPLENVHGLPGLLDALRSVASVEEGLAQVSVVGTGIGASKDPLERALRALGVEPRGVLVAPLRIAFLVPRESAKECVRRLHAEFVERS